MIGAAAGVRGMRSEEAIEAIRSGELDPFETTIAPFTSFRT